MSRSQRVANARQDGEPLLRLAASRVGLRRAFRVLGYMVAWDMARDALGAEPSTEQYAAHWKETNATAYRDAALFREAFPGEQNPARLLALAGEQSADVRALGATLVPA